MCLLTNSLDTPVCAVKRLLTPPLDKSIAFCSSSRIIRLSSSSALAAVAEASSAPNPTPFNLCFRAFRCRMISATDRPSSSPLGASLLVGFSRSVLSSGSAASVVVASSAGLCLKNFLFLPRNTTGASVAAIASAGVVVGASVSMARLLESASMFKNRTTRSALDGIRVATAVCKD